MKQKKYLVEEVKPNKLISKQYKKVCKTLNYIKHLLILPSMVSGCISISAFAFLVIIPVGIVGLGIRIKICAATAIIKRFKSIVKKKKETQWNIVAMNIVR